MDTTDTSIFRYGLVMYKKEGLRHQGQYSIIGIFFLYNIKKHHSFCVSDTRTTNPHQTGTLLLLGCTTDTKNHLGGYAKLIRNIYSNRGTESPTNACCKRWSCRSFNHPIHVFPIARLWKRRCHYGFQHGKQIVVGSCNRAGNSHQGLVNIQGVIYQLTSRA